MSIGEKINKHLEGMVGKTFSYAKNIHQVVSCQVDELEQEFTIHTNLNRFVRKFASFVYFIQYWTLMEQVSPMPQLPATNNNVPAAASEEDNKALAALVESETALADDMIKILQDNITKVQANPGYLGQAQVINNNVNTILNVVKMKMALLKEIKRRK